MISFPETISNFFSFVSLSFEVSLPFFFSFFLLVGWFAFSFFGQHVGFWKSFGNSVWRVDIRFISQLWSRKRNI